MTLRFSAVLTLSAAIALANLSPVRPAFAAEPALRVTVPAGAPMAAPRFVVFDPETGRGIAGAEVTIEDAHSLVIHPALQLKTAAPLAGPTAPFDVVAWKALPIGTQLPPGMQTEVHIPVGTSVLLYQQTSTPRAPGAPPIKDIYIKVTASRAQAKPPVTSNGITRTGGDLNTFHNSVTNDAGSLTRGQSGVASDSAGQQHVRGEHADISFVVDGVPLPDTLSGRQGSIVVPSTIQSLTMLTGGFAPEFGGQTAAVLDIATLPSARTMSNDLTIATGTYGSFDTDFTSIGPIGDRASYVFNISDDRSSNALEPQQPDDQTAHNGGDDQSIFAKFRVTPEKRDTVTLTFSHAPSTLEISNRTGLGSSFAAAGQGYGFEGLRDANGTIPSLTPASAGLLGAQVIPLATQQQDGMSINQTEVNEFGTLSLRHQFDTYDVGQISEVILHSAQDVTNQNPAIDLNNLPVDNSIEYNPTSHRSVYHYQLSSDFTTQRSAHTMKVGILSDQEVGNESYQLIPASQLALDELAALSPSLAPDGSVETENGAAVKDVYGNPVFTAAKGAASPTLTVHRSGFYDAAYVQDTWKATSRFTANYGVRYDRYRQGQNLGQPIVDQTAFSPRINLSYALPSNTILRTSYDRLFNIPPLAQGAVVGEPIQPEKLNQYDVSLEHQVTRNQTTKVAYYYKEMRNQVDTGLLIPGSENGIYSAVNFQYGAVHGTEFSYDISPPGGVGFDGYLNYTNSRAQPNGLDNTGAPAPQYNDHDQRNTVGAGLAYIWKSTATAAFTLNYGSGLASSVVPPSTNRTARTEVDLHLASSPHLLYGGHGGLGFDVTNLFDDRSVINFESGFSGTRFVEGRRLLFSTFLHF